MHSLFDGAAACIAACDAAEKARLSRETAARWRAGELNLTQDAPPAPIGEPGRPARPALVAPRDLARRTLTTLEGRAALIHAVAHIEFNAINLAWDAVYRFRGMPPQFYADWTRWPTRRRITTHCCTDVCGGSVMTTAIFPPTTACGSRRARRPTTCWCAWRWCRGCSRRAGWM